MPQSLVKNYVHIVFSTKHRVDFIDEQVEKEMFSYIAAICKDFESTALQIGGTDNHIHILCLLSRKIALMKLVQEIKAHSSKWIKTKGKKYEYFFLAGWLWCIFCGRKKFKYHHPVHQKSKNTSSKYRFQK